MKLVLLHAGTNDGDCWQFMGLDGAHVHLLPGHGARFRQPMSLGEMADEVAEMMHGRFDVLGVAFGGMIAQHLLLRHPTRVRSAIIACTSPSLAAMHDQLLDRANDAERSGLEPVVSSTLARWFTEQALARDDPCVQYARRTMLTMDRYAYADMWRSMAEHEVTDCLKHVRHPVTLVAAENDAALGAAGMELLHRELPNSRLDYVAGPHMLHLECPEALKAALARHLAWVNAAGTPESLE